jgi:hypothetical protein
MCCADKEKELGDAQAEIKALRLSDRAREKAVQDVSNPPPMRRLLLTTTSAACFFLFLFSPPTTTLTLPPASINVSLRKNWQRWTRSSSSPSLSLRPRSPILLSFCKTCAAKQIFVIIMCVYAKRVLQNLEAKRISDEKKAALAAQFAAEATLRRVHAAQKDDDMPPIEAILAPLEAELKLARQEVSKSPFFNLGVKMLACY